MEEGAEAKSLTRGQKQTPSRVLGQTESSLTYTEASPDWAVVSDSFPCTLPFGSIALSRGLRCRWCGSLELWLWGTPSIGQLVAG